MFCSLLKVNKDSRSTIRPGANLIGFVGLCNSLNLIMVQMWELGKLAITKVNLGWNLRGRDVI